MKKTLFTLAAVVTIGGITTGFTSISSHAEKEDHSTSAKFQNLSRDTKWEEKAKIDLAFNTFHPQGMTKIGDLFYMSSVEILEKPVKYDQPKEGYDRSPGKGIGHLFVFNKKGQLLNDIKLGEGDVYHPGGIDFDGESIWVPVAEYRPNSKSIIYKLDPDTLDPHEAFKVDDHIGGIVKEKNTEKLKAVSWGSRTFYEFNQTGKELKKSKNTSHFIDYQDCESTDKDNMICSGITELPQQDEKNGKYELGGLALLNMKSMETTYELPVAKFSPQGHVITRNPVYLENTHSGLKLFAVPDDDKSSLLVYETKTEKN